MPANEVGLAILGPLRELDEVAYLRFASVYRAFESADDFETEIAMLRAERQPTGDEPDLTDAPARSGSARRAGLTRATSDAPPPQTRHQTLHHRITPTTYDRSNTRTTQTSQRTARR